MGIDGKSQDEWKWCQRSGPHGPSKNAKQSPKTPQQCQSWRQDQFSKTSTNGWLSFGQPNKCPNQINQILEIQ